MKVFISGIRGFIGSHLANQLALEGHDVRGVDNLFHSCDNPLHKAIHWLKLDIREKDAMGTLIKECDIVFHLAAQIHVDYSIKFPQETIDINVSGTLNVLEACRKYSKKLIFASTSEAYGSSQTEYMSEDHPLDSQSPYGASKVAGDRLCKSYIDTYGMNIVIVRNFNFFGPYQNDGSYGSVIALFTRAAFRNEPLQIFGDGLQERDYMYIDDGIQAYKYAMKMKPGVYNFGTGRTVKILEVAHKIKNITHSHSSILHRNPRPGEVRRLCADITRVKHEGFSPVTNFDKDLEKYIEWYRNIREY